MQLEKQAKPYPSTRRGDSTVSVAGSDIADPYAWLQTSTPEVETWEREQTEAAVDYIRSWSGFEQVRTSIEALPAEHDGATTLGLFTPPVQVVGGWLRRASNGSGERDVLVIGATPTDAGEVVLDPWIAFGAGTNIDLFSVAPNGKVLAYWVSEREEESNTRLHLFDLERRVDVPAEFPQLFEILSAGAAWTPDSSGFYFCARDEASDAYGMQLFFHRLDEAAPTSAELTLPPFCVPYVAEDGRFAMVLNQYTRRPTHFRDLKVNGAWEPFTAAGDAQWQGVAVGDCYIAVTTSGADRGRLVSVPLATQEDSSTWRELVAETSAVLRSVHCSGQRLILSEYVETVARLRVLDLEGTELYEVALPPFGTIEAVVPPLGVGYPPEGHFVFPFMSFGQSLTTYDLEVESGQLSVLQPAADVNSDLAISLERCTAGDGETVTYQIVQSSASSNSEQPEPRPTIIHFYGGSVFTPFYTGWLAPFFAAGGRYVHANIRGGGEHGQLHADAGRTAHFQQSLNDLYAIAEDLIDRKLSTAAQLAIVGHSAGGHRAALAGIQRPELFRAVVARAPITDLVGWSTDPYGRMGLTLLFADPETDAGMQYIHDLSPYYKVDEGVRYPALLIECGESDHRCPPWHAAKLVARLQNSADAPSPVLFREWPETGHGASTPPRIRIEQTAEWVAFVMQELGVAAE